MIQQENFHLTQSKTGVTFYIFSDLIFNSISTAPDQFEGPFPTYITYNNLGIIDSVNFFTGGTLWKRNSQNNYVPLDQTGLNYMTGYTVVKTIPTDMTQEGMETMSQNMLSRMSDPNRLGTPPSASAATNYVFYDKKLIDDFYVDVKMQRSFKSLDTLKINNNLINSFPTQESPTGVVFGRLMAIQKLKNEQGQNIKIPLQNVPIGIFNSSEDFPNTFSLDDNGDRMTLNIKESSILGDYFNELSYNIDQNSYLKSGESFSGVPAQYKYITKTNENGEFILYDIPVGQQIAVLEVDLFKQGLTKDEIALNFFPFPTIDNPNVDTVPSFVFKQFPIDVVPAWGLTQTGYTRLDVNINLDLRKWTTYILPPVTNDDKKLDLTTAENQDKTLKVKVRDMTAPKFELRPVEIVQIPNDLDRDVGSQYSWFDEFIQKRTTIQYNRFGCHVFKLPGNIWDPNSYATDKNGIPTTRKGVWLSSYQFSIFLTENLALRSTGALSYYTPNGHYIRSHYYLNYTNGNDTDIGVLSSPPKVGVYPYEKPWSASYPEPYSIPRKPTQQRFYSGADRMLHPSSTPSNPIYYIEEPIFSDGDLIGSPVWDSIGNAGGFGVQYFNNAWFYNRIANVATKSYMYKYESSVSWNETYANGYEPYWNTANSPYSYTEYPFAGISRVVGGEKFQRLECGYGYFVKPEGWSRITKAPWSSDIPYDLSFLNGNGVSENPGPAIAPQGVHGGMFYRAQKPLTLYNLENVNFALHLGSGSLIKEGSLDFYRIIESGADANGNLTNIAEFTNFVIPTYSTLRIEGAFLCYGINVKNKGEIPVTVRNPFRGTVQKLDPSGDVVEYYGPNQLVPIDVNESFELVDNPASGSFPYAGSPNGHTQNALTQYFYDGTSNIRTAQYNGEKLWVRDTVSFTALILPGNSNPSTDNANIYTRSRYDIEIKYYKRGSSSVLITPNPKGPLSGTTSLTINQAYQYSTGIDPFEILKNDRTFSQDYANYEAWSTQLSVGNNSRNAQLIPNSTVPAEGYQYGTTSFNGIANVDGSNIYRVRTQTNGADHGLIHEGIGKYFFYGNKEYFRDKDIYAYTPTPFVIEGPGSSIWGNYNDGNEDYGYGHYI